LVSGPACIWRTYRQLYYIRNIINLHHPSPAMTLKIISLLVLSCIALNASCQEYESCGYSGEEAWAGDTAAITAFLIACGRIDTTNYDEHGKKTKGKPHHQSISMKLNSGKELHNDSIYFMADEMPRFPGGDDSLMAYLKANIHYPPAALASRKEGKVIVSFIIGRNGMPSHVKLIRGIGNGCDEEALRLVRTMPKWIPGKVKGKDVRVQFNLPVKFQLNS
jgi:TonB family protein